MLTFTAAGKKGKRVMKREKGKAREQIGIEGVQFTEQS